MYPRRDQLNRRPPKTGYGIRGKSRSRGESRDFTVICTPGLYLAGFMCVMFLDLLRRGRSTWRFAVVAAGGAVTAVLDLLLHSDAASPAAQPGMALYVGLLLSATLHWGDTMRRRAAVASTVAAMAVVGALALALLLVGVPATSILAGALAGTTWAAAVEASTRARWPALRLRLGNGRSRGGQVIDDASA